MRFFFRLPWGRICLISASLFSFSFAWPSGGPQGIASSISSSAAENIRKDFESLNSSASRSGHGKEDPLKRPGVPPFDVRSAGNEGSDFKKEGIRRMDADPGKESLRKKQNGQSAHPRKKEEVHLDPYERKMKVFQSFIAELAKMERQIKEEEKKKEREKLEILSDVDPSELPVPVKGAVIGGDIVVYATFFGSGGASFTVSGAAQRLLPKNKKSKVKSGKREKVPLPPLPSVKKMDIRSYISPGEKYFELYEGQEFGNWKVAKVTEKFVLYKNKKTGKEVKKYY